ncbi:hypothetical protein [Mesobacillus subterraneus]|uniref:hypothetical protein n=1 Tax=Mesobacillus subterraneus TaxID=285983 RepID=UPI0014735349|nr:hypothetical protein [Mesobacillus subterraneus]
MMRNNLSTEDKLKLTELKKQLLNVPTPDERHTALKEIEHILKKARQRHKFMTK